MRREELVIFLLLMIGLVLVGCGKTEFEDASPPPEQDQKVEVTVISKESDSKDQEKEKKSKEEDVGDDEDNEGKEGSSKSSKDKEDNGVYFCLNDQGSSDKKRSNYINYKNNDESISFCYKVIK